MAKIAAAPGGVLLFICYLGFVSLGLPDTLIGVAWPSVRDEFQLEQSDLAWVFVGAGCTYLLSSFSAGRLLKRFRVGTILAGSSALVALSSVDYGLARNWGFFVTGSLLHGLGSGAIDAGLNHYVAHHFSPRHMNWLHACYTLGAMLGPMVMTAAVTRAASWRVGYLVVALFLLVLASLFLVTKARWNDPGDSRPESGAEEKSAREVTAREALRHRLVWLQIFLFFIYTGLEVALGQWSYTVLTESRGVAPKMAGLWVSLYWGSILAGRIGFGFVLERIGIDRLIRLSTMAAVAGTSIFASNARPELAPLGLAVAGLGLAVIYPCLMSRTPERLGKGTAAHAIGFQVAAATGGAVVLPSLTGWVADQVGLQEVPLTILAMAVVLLLLHEWLLSRSRKA